MHSTQLRYGSLCNNSIKTDVTTATKTLIILCFTNYFAFLRHFYLKPALNRSKQQRRLQRQGDAGARSEGRRRVAAAAAAHDAVPHAPDLAHQTDPAAEGS